MKSGRSARPSFLRRLARHRGGMAAVELALIAPVMIFVYFGIAEVTMAMMADRRASHAASTIGDLVAQSTQMNTSTMTDIFSIGTALMRPFPSAPLQMRVSSVQMDAANKITVVWSKGSGMGALTPGSSVVDAKLQTMMSPYDSIIMTEMSYSYQSPLGQVLPNALNFSDKTFLKPRQSDQVIWVN